MPRGPRRLPRRARDVYPWLHRGRRGLPVRWATIQALLASVWTRVMDGTAVIFTLLLIVAALITDLAGFAFGVVAAAVWLHVISPLESATLIVAFGLVVQGHSARHFPVESVAIFAMTTVGPKRGTVTPHSAWMFLH